MPVHLTDTFSADFLLLFSPFSFAINTASLANLFMEDFFMQKKTQKHLSLDERIRIQSLLEEDFSLRYIADRLGKSPSTVSRKLKKHAASISPNCCDCLNSSGCSHLHICGASVCRKKCKSCSKAKKYCPDYVQSFCDTLLSHPLHLCNSCFKKNLCHFERRFYNGKNAQKQYEDTLVNSRNGFDLTASQLDQINSIVTPLVRKGQSVYHIVKTNQDLLPVSESSLRRLINSCELDVRLIDLPEAVKRKPRRRPQHHPEPQPSKTGHLYQDFLSFIRSNDTPVVQMDCVEGTKEDSGAILSLHFVTFHMQLYFALEKHDSASVTGMLDRIESSLGKDLFAACFPLILTDNGKEFSDINGMERSVFGGKRTKIFFCEPNRSDQKSQCENNHKLFRRIVPKGTSIERFWQADMSLATDHINSYIRKSLFGRCPYDLARAALPADFFILLGLEQLPAKEVVLTPELLK